MKFLNPAYKRTLWSLVLIVLLGLLILLTSFYRVITYSVNEVRSRQLDRAALQFKERLQELPMPKRSDENWEVVEKYPALWDSMEFMSHLINAHVWLVMPNGRVIYTSRMPDEEKTAIFERPDLNTLRLDADHVGSEWGDNGVVLKGGNFHGLFSGLGGSWLSVVRPIVSGGKVHAYLHIHERVNFLRDFQLYLLNGLAISMAVAIVVAMGFIWVFMRQLTKPIELLSSAADQVALGDLSVQVSLPPVSAIAIFDEHNRIRHLISTFNHMIRRLEASNTEQRDFISSISHDLKTPLTSINGFVQGILDGTIPPEMHQRYLKIVGEESQRMSDLVKDMNQVVQLDGHALEYNFESFGLNQMVYEVIVSLMPILEEKHITIQNDGIAMLNSETPYEVLGDATKLHRVFQNLLQNASKFVSDYGVISISCQEAVGQDGAQYLLLTIEDDGPGIPEKDWPQVFERFFKADRSRNNRSGSGLGLYICRQILRAHGQQIWVDRSELGGAKFCFTLPMS
ncbi:MAG: HAMP domain-containing sensor histidine kinase [Eubacteriales bacterium]|nr:HAMP domain-containing sensor histidine kinase [Eubacteriales bacterium]